jgi:AcrR family transcriptional regulator
MARASSRLTGPERRARILEAAAQAFAAHGYHMASIREIAHGSGVTKPVLYDHFPSKQQLYVAVIESVRDELTAGTAAAMGRPRPLEARLRAAFDGFFRYVEARPAAARVLFTTPDGDPVIVAAAQRVQSEASTRLATLLAAEPELMARVAERERQLAILMEFLKTGLHGLATWWTQHPDIPRTLLVDTVMQTAWSGLQSQFNSASVVEQPLDNSTLE